MKVLVCDDEEDHCKEVERAIGDAGQPDIEVVSLVKGALVGELEKLFDNVKKCMDDPKSYKLGDQLSFDTADVVILDNNLANLEIKGTRLTAESIAGYVRAFTAAPYIVSLNKNPDVDFDLRYLVGDYATRADLALNDRHLPNPSLWTGKHADVEEGFLPWYWPKLATVADRRREQIAFVKKHLTDSLFGALEIPKEAVDVFSRPAKDPLSPDADSDGVTDDGVPNDDVTFLDFFVARDRSLPVKKDRKKLTVEAKAGNETIRELISRVVAAEIDLWFRRDIVGPQEALVDVPHLLMRMPFLLGGNVGNLEAWKEAVVAEVAPFGMDQELFDQFLKSALFKHDIWTRPGCFWWPKLRDTEKLNELFTASESEWADAVFCEDISDFVIRETPEGTAPKEFVAEFDSPWDRRHVKQVTNFKYSPKSRFAV